MKKQFPLIVFGSFVEISDPKIIFLHLFSNYAKFLGTNAIARTCKSWRRSPIETRMTRMERTLARQGPTNERSARSALIRDHAYLC